MAAASTPSLAQNMTGPVALTHPDAPTLVLGTRDALGRILHAPLVPEVSDEQRARLRSAYWYRYQAQPRLYKLRKRLMTLAGGEPCFAYHESDLNKLLARGQVFGGRCHLQECLPNQCHTNVATMWAHSGEQRPAQIVTGYALGDEGLWRQHSWLIAISNKKRVLIETTCRRLLYYGVVLTETEAALFARCCGVR